jgi:DNA-binding MarR family transcriptional regulator
MYHSRMTSNQEFIEKIRSFNRFYTNIIGLLDQHYLETPYSLTESRILYEISHTSACSAKKIRQIIAIDEGYLSRIIHKFEQQGLVKKTASPQDKRLHIILLTEKGQLEFARLDDNSNQLTAQLIEKLSEKEREELTHMMTGIHTLLDRNNPIGS